MDLKSRCWVATMVLIASPARAQAPLAGSPSPQMAQQFPVFAQSQAPGLRPASPVFAAPDPQPSASFWLQLNTGTCYTFIGLGGLGVLEVDMYLFEPTGRTVAYDKSPGPQMRLFYCSPLTGTFRTELKVKRGAGEVAFQAFEPRTTPAKPALPRDAEPSKSPPSEKPTAMEDELPGSAPRGRQAGPRRQVLPDYPKHK